MPLFLLTVWGGLKRAWLWFKKYWMWLIFPIGLLVFLVGRFSGRKPPEVVAPELLGAAKVKLEADEEAEESQARAKADRDRRSEAVLIEHNHIIKKLDERQKGKVAELVEDPVALNAFLLAVGREMRDE